MSPTITASLITAVASLLVVIPGLLLRRRSKSAVILRRSLNRQEELENYVFVLRRQVNSMGRKPHPWPRNLSYLNRDDQDQQVDDEQS